MKKLVFAALLAALSCLTAYSSQPTAHSSQPNWQQMADGMTNALIKR